MLLGISLVVQELHKGPRLIYRYPNRDSNYYNSLFDYFEEVPQPSKGVCNGNLLRSVYNQYFALRSSLFCLLFILLLSICSDENFAKLFRKPPLGKILEVTVGDLELTCFPCSCPQGDNDLKQEIVSKETDKQEDVDQHSSRPVNFHQISMFNIILALVPLHVVQRLHGKHSSVRHLYPPVVKCYSLTERKSSLYFTNAGEMPCLHPLSSALFMISSRLGLCKMTLTR
jgi:hypothetical protein